jgi:indolepyruvate ferredoxin oxidoreductase
MAYKDEYEVARLYTDGRFAARVAEQFEGDFKLEFNLAPPLFARRDPVTGELRKRAYGPWMMAAFRLLARMKGLRGTRLDLFGYQAERRKERSLIDEYEHVLEDVVSRLSSLNRTAAVEIARLPDSIKGYGHIKDASIGKAEAQLPRLLEAFNQQSQPALPAMGATG